MKISSVTLARTIIIASITFSAACFAGFESGSPNDRFGRFCDTYFCQHQPPLPSKPLVGNISGQIEDNSHEDCKDYLWSDACHQQPPLPSKPLVDNISGQIEDKGTVAFTVAYQGICVHASC